MKIELSATSYIIMENGLLHNLEGPAWVHEDGTMEYYVNGKLHREEGPARLLADGSKEIWFNGEFQGRITTDGTYHPWK